MGARLSRQHDPSGVTVSNGMPTELDPEVGAFITEGISWPAVRWIADDGAYVVESTEFDLRGLGHDWDEAFMSFGTAAWDLFQYLSDLSREGRATPDESETAARIGGRILATVQTRNERLEDELLRPRGLLGALKLRQHALTAVERKQTWDPDDQEMQANSRPLSVA